MKEYIVSRFNFFVTLTTLSALLAGHASASTSDNTGHSSNIPIQLEARELPLIPANMGRDIRTFIFDLVARCDSTDNNFFNHENLRSLEMVNIATAFQVRDYRKLRNVLPRLVLSIPTRSELLELLLLNNAAPVQNNAATTIQWRIRSENPMGGQDNSDLRVMYDENKEGKSTITFPNFCISQITENSLVLSCELLYEKLDYSSRHGRERRKLSFIRLSRTVQLPHSANVNFVSFMPKPLEPDSISEHSVTYSNTVSYGGANKEDLIFKMDLNANNGILGEAPHTPPFISTKPDNALCLSQEDSSIVISAPRLQTLMQMLKSEYTNAAQSNLVSPEGWKITCGRSCDFLNSSSGRPYDLSTKLRHLEEGFRPKLMSVSLIQHNDQAIMSCRYIYAKQSPYYSHKANKSELYAIVYNQRVTLPESCAIAFQPLRPLDVPPQSRCDRAITFGVDRTDQALEDGFTFACGYRIAVPEDIE